MNEVLDSHGVGLVMGGAVMFTPHLSVFYMGNHLFCMGNHE